MWVIDYNFIIYIAFVNVNYFYFYNNRIIIIENNRKEYRRV